ncbi:MAG: 16S rRNA (guanine(527)-N(7))-methyltransferase RsmG [Solirubrobacteraceae bacterium]
MSPEVAARLRTLTLDYGLEPEVEIRLALLLGHLAAEAKRAPTTVAAPDRAVDVHVADSLAALALEVVRGARSVADLGAGAGIPGLVLAAAMPQARVSLVESRQGKCAFMAGMATAMGLTNAHVVCSRMEEWAAGADVHDLVTARALAPQPVVLEYAAPLLRLHGHLVEWRGARRSEEEEAALRAAGALGLRRVEVRRVLPFPAAQERHLHVFEKAERTPERFPRRPGVASRKPLVS